MHAPTIAPHLPPPSASTSPVGGNGSDSALTVGSTSQQCTRPQVRGKFIFIGDEKFWVKGVTYGAFRPDGGGNEYRNHDVIERDFAQMAAWGINTVRIPHTMPPRSLLDIAQRHGLRVMVGLSAEQYAGFLIDRDKKAPDVLGTVAAKVRTVAGHPALLCYAVGNEIPAAMVRWIGRRRVERYIESVCRTIKAEDPEGLVTYVNYPTTEYLQLPFLDLVAFNVYLESEDRLAAYLARLQNIAAERPLIMSEVGLDSIRNGELAQAKSLDWQIRTAFASGCAGVVVFSWTDEWHRAERDVDDWAFGLTTRTRDPKPALAAVAGAFAEAPFPVHPAWPRISVVVCSYNGSRTIRDTLDGMMRLEYLDVEIIVVDDGSTDTTPQIASEYPVKLITTENRGLSSARNTGWQEASGEIVAYIDDDAYPDPHWLHYLAYTFMTTDFVGVGGPNIAPPGDGPIAECVANAPGGPVHVLLSDVEAEHIPGCNMAFRRAALEAIGGFDPRYRAAGDDVDLCWRLQKRGWKLGFHAAALDWHHRRNSVTMYWKQQIGYGKAEALLEEKWPEKYNPLGHTTWAGRLYGKGFTLPLWLQQRVYQGVMGSALFQSLYEKTPGTFISLPLTPEWYLLVAGLGLLSAIGLLWPPLLWMLVVLFSAVALPVIQASISASRANFKGKPQDGWSWTRRWLVTAGLHLLQPLARLRGRVLHGLTPWRHTGRGDFTIPVARSFAVWTARWEAPESRSAFLEQELCRSGALVVHGGPYDSWDMGVPGGLLGGARLLTAIEDHGAGTQYIRSLIRPRFSPVAVGVVALLGALAILAAADSAWAAAGILAAFASAAAARTAYEAGSATAILTKAVAALERNVRGEET
jgi:GT2 family glycosyltransferase